MGDERSQGRDGAWGETEPYNYGWRQRNNVPLTPHQLAQWEKYRDGQMAWRKERAQFREKRVRKWAPVIAEARYRGKTYEEVAKIVGVSVSTVWCWEHTFASIFQAELDAIVEREHNLIQLVTARKTMEGRRKLALALPDAVDKLAHLSANAKLEKVQLDASKSIVSFNGLGRDKAEGAARQFSPGRKQFVTAVVEKALPGCTVTQEAEVVEVIRAGEKGSSSQT